MKRHYPGFKRVMPEKHIDDAARHATDRICSRIAVRTLQPVPRDLRNAIREDIGDCVRLHSKLEER